MLKQLAQMAMAAAMVAGLAAVPARADDMSDLLHDANRTVDNLKRDPAFATARTMLRNARAVYIVPKLVKGGFIFGAEGGDGVLLRRQGRGWSQPRFYSMGSASFGLQAGLQQAQLVFIINSDRALSGIEHGNFKLGAGAGVTVVNLSSGRRPIGYVSPSSVTSLTSRLCCRLVSLNGTCAVTATARRRC